MRPATAARRPGREWHRQHQAARTEHRQQPMSTPLPQYRQTSSLAVVSLVLGILGWTLLPFLGSIGAIVTGHLARAGIRREPARYDGDGFAIAGLILGWLAVAAWIVGVAAFVLFFGGMVWLAGHGA